jgi:hypothetical protein
MRRTIILTLALLFAIVIYNLLNYKTVVQLFPKLPTFEFITFLNFIDTIQYNPIAYTGNWIADGFVYVLNNVANVFIAFANAFITLFNAIIYTINWIGSLFSFLGNLLGWFVQLFQFFWNITVGSIWNIPVIGPIIVVFFLIILVWDVLNYIRGLPE